MSRHIELKGRKFWIVSEPDGEQWIAAIGEAQTDGSNLPLGIVASADTRGAADDAAERKLRRLLQAY